MKIEQLEAVLEMAVKAGAIRSYSREKSDDAAHFCATSILSATLMTTTPSSGILI